MPPGTLRSARPSSGSTSRLSARAHSPDLPSASGLILRLWGAHSAFINRADTSTVMSQPRAAVGAASWRHRTWLAPGLLVYSICRIPSFFEPHWYTDEAGYATTARAGLRGLPLYVQARNNNPPLPIWAVALPLSLFGSREARFHAPTFVSGPRALVAAGPLARPPLSPRP